MFNFLKSRSHRVRPFPTSSDRRLQTTPTTTASSPNSPVSSRAWRSTCAAPTTRWRRGTPHRHREELIECRATKRSRRLGGGGPRGRPSRVRAAQCRDRASVFRSHIRAECAGALVARAVVLVLVQRPVIGFLVEGLAAGRALEDIGWTGCPRDTRAARCPAR